MLVSWFSLSLCLCSFSPRLYPQKCPLMSCWSPPWFQMSPDSFLCYLSLSPAHLFPLGLIRLVPTVFCQFSFLSTSLQPLFLIFFMFHLVWTIPGFWISPLGCSPWTGFFVWAVYIRSLDIRCLFNTSADLPVVSAAGSGLSAGFIHATVGLYSTCVLPVRDQLCIKSWENTTYHICPLQTHEHTGTETGPLWRPDTKTQEEQYSVRCPM